MRRWGVTEFQEEYCSVDPLLTEIWPKTEPYDSVMFHGAPGMFWLTQRTPHALPA